MQHKYWNVLDYVPINIRNQFLTMMEEYVSQLPKEDEILLREHYLPITKISMRMRTTLSGIARTEAQVLENAVRERCVGVPEKRIKRIISILDKAFKYTEPRFFEMMTCMKSGRLQSGICVPGSNCHYTKEFMMYWITFPSKFEQSQECKDYLPISPLDVHTYDHLSATKVISPIDLRTYTQMKIIELVPGIVNTNKVIYGTLLVDGHNMGSFHTVVEDDFGQCAKLSIRNTTPELQDSLKKGVRIAIANPYYKLGTTDEYYFIRMDSPEEIIVQIYNQEDSNLNQSSEDHKLEGNKHFKAGEYVKAVSCYTIAIAKDPSNPVYLSNRALCYLKLDSFEDALHDAEAAVELDSNTHKYQYRLAMAWSALGDHEKSVEILETIQDNSECLAFLSKEKKLLNNSGGEFNFDEIAQKAMRGEKLEIADFIGPIIIDKSLNHGHGVFATRDIKKGELICVQKAIAYVEPKKRDILKDKAELFIFADHLSISPRGVLPKMNQSLIEKIVKSKLSAFRLFTLYTKHLNSEPISIELYGSKGYQCVRDKEKPLYQMQQIVTIIQKNALSYPHPADLVNIDMHTHGLWLIRAFLNHSCLPNSSLTFYKDVCIVHANVNIRKGTELTAPRIAQLSLEKRRNELLSKWDYICDCELCEFESDPRNKNALARAILLRERADKQTDESYYSDYPAMQDFHFKLLEKAFSLAKEMQLGPTRFNTAVWQAIHYSLSAIPEPKDEKKFLKALNRAKSILCDYELEHQLELWKRWKFFLETSQAPLPDDCKTEVEENFKLLNFYQSNIPTNISQ